MIKIIEQTNKNYETRCKECGTLFLYESEDVDHDGKFNYFVECPRCHNKIFDIDQEEFVEDVTLENINFPKSFYSFEGGVSIDDNEVTEWCKEGLRALEKSPMDNDFYVCGTGNTKVIVLKLKDKYDVTVAKNYYEASIDR